MKEPISICWLRRDLRLEDHAAFHHALKSNYPVLLLFIFDRAILDRLPHPDPRVVFIHRTLMDLKARLEHYGSSLLIKYGFPDAVMQELINDYNVKAVYTNHDYEPYAIKRDSTVEGILHGKSIPFFTYKDQVIFEKSEIVKADKKPYTVFTPYFTQWKAKLNDFYVKAYPTQKYRSHLLQIPALLTLELEDIGFQDVDREFPKLDFAAKLASYELRRDYPADDATSYIGLHLRFGTISIRQAARIAIANQADKWLSELVWRDFYMMILYHFPFIQQHAFKPAYDQIPWRNNEQEFEAWCNGKTGYPIVDAGMHQLNQTGFMHNRVRMVVASFLVKHLLIDWRWGEAYFADKLLDYELASNVGGWQWACGSGNDAAPYFRVFNPELQAKKFDPKNVYIYKWAPEYKQEKHDQPIVDHAFARDRVLRVYKAAFNGSALS
jgi:deoxyribodipyrimidine photo-lyase